MASPKPKNTKKTILIVILSILGVSAIIIGVTLLIINHANNQAELDYPDSSSHYIDDYYDENGEKRPLPYLAKPIIYLYPETETEISVTLGRPELLTTTYPEYMNGWRVLAEPSGKLTDLDTGRELYALYWEGLRDQAHLATIKADGFIVTRADTTDFLEEKLALLGLNEREAEEFIVYWLPRLRESAYNYIRFETAAEINSTMPLTISPQPDTTIRVMMTFAHLDSPDQFTVREQILTPATRQGFTVVEWGGSEILSQTLE